MIELVNALSAIFISPTLQRAPNTLAHAVLRYKNLDRDYSKSIDIRLLEALAVDIIDRATDLWKNNQLVDYVSLQSTRSFPAS
jgi:hypothetical protein